MQGVSGCGVTSSAATLHGSGVAGDQGCCSTVEAHDGADAPRVAIIHLNCWSKEARRTSSLLRRKSCAVQLSKGA